MSSGPQPFFCSVMIVLFINTVQRLPKSAGFVERKAASAILSVGILSDEAKTYLTNTFGDLETYLQTQIEATVSANKKTPTATE